jgi:methionyl aminopeptidase
MVLAIEPMINEKGPDVRVLDDGWTAITCDNGFVGILSTPSVITENGPEILTEI